MGSAAPAAALERFDPAGLEGFDEPVRRFFAHALDDGAPLAPAARFSMTGRIRIGRLWVPFTAVQVAGREACSWTARVGVGPLTPLTVRDVFAEGRGRTEGRLLDRRRLFGEAGEDVARSGAGRSALDACVFAPASLLPRFGVDWHAESDEVIVASWPVPPEHPEVHVRLHADGAVRAAWCERWGQDGPEHRYVPCGGDVHEERRFGAVTVPSRLTASWWYATERRRPFFEAHLRDYALVG